MKKSNKAEVVETSVGYMLNNITYVGREVKRIKGFANFINKKFDDCGCTVNEPNGRIKSAIYFYRTEEDLLKEYLENFYDIELYNNRRRIND